MGTMNVRLSSLFLLVFAAVAFGQNMPSKSERTISIRHAAKDFAISDLNNNAWRRADETTVGSYWNGVPASAGRQFTAQLLWTENALYVRFIAKKEEPLVVSKKPNLNSKTMGLWDRDVCEIFIAPDPNESRKYFEFEIAPNGEWIDLAIDLTSGKRKTQWDYKSGMESAAKIEKDKVIMAIKVPWKALGKTPKAGDVWLGNLLRCVGTDPNRGYLAWQPTMTKEPNFHVPEKFGEFEFTP